jgi:hypothetical protein
MYPRIPWELVADPLESVEHSLGTTGLIDGKKEKNRGNYGKLQ